MNDKLKDFLKFASENEEVSKKFEQIKDETDKGKVIEFTIKEAKAHGFELTADDFTHAEMDDNELEAVSGGWKQCVCAMLGGGDDDDDGGECVCALIGLGYRRDNPEIERCACAVGGFGNDYFEGDVTDPCNI